MPPTMEDYRDMIIETASDVRYLKESLKESVDGLKESIDTCNETMSALIDDHEERLRVIEQWKNQTRGEQAAIAFVGTVVGAIIGAIGTVVTIMIAFKEFFFNGGGMP